MKKRKIINIALLLTVIALLITGAMFVRIRPMADRVTVLSAAGMTCDRCGSAIERALQAKPGVTAVEIDLKGSRVIVAYDSKTTDPAVISSTVRCLGYRNSIADCLSAEQYRTLTGRDPEHPSCGVCSGLGK
jgi:copper chaperone CopZ